MSRKDLTHTNKRGDAHMVDVGQKQITSRRAIASGEIRMLPQTLDIIKSGTAKKGDVLATARIAGIMAAKKTSELIPLCHPLPLTKISIDLDANDDLPGFLITASVSVSGKTGVEMEALTAVSTACLTLYDMLKAVDRGMIICNIRVLEKHGGKSGSYRAES